MAPAASGPSHAADATHPGRSLSSFAAETHGSAPDASYEADMSFSLLFSLSTNPIGHSLIRSIFCLVKAISASPPINPRTTPAAPAFVCGAHQIKTAFLLPPASSPHPLSLFPTFSLSTKPTPLPLLFPESCFAADVAHLLPDSFLLPPSKTSIHFLPKTEQTRFCGGSKHITFNLFTKKVTISAP